MFITQQSAQNIANEMKRAIHHDINIMDANGIILASTSEVYGKSTGELFKETDDLHLGSPHHSRWSYACSKLLDEFILMAYHHQQDLPGTIVRFFNTVGPRQTGRYGMVVPRFVKAALAGEPLKVYGDGQQSRCFCHVADVVRALKSLLHCQDSIGRICNIGSQELITIEDLAKLAIARLNSTSELERIPYEQAYAKGFEDMMRRRPDTTAIHSLTGWQAEKSLEEIIDDMVMVLRDRHTKRLKSGACSISSGLVFMEMLTYMERASDQCSSIAVMMLARDNAEILADHHEYLQNIHSGNDADYAAEKNRRREQYIKPLLKIQ